MLKEKWQIVKWLNLDILLRETAQKNSDKTSSGTADEVLLSNHLEKHGSHLPYFFQPTELTEPSPKVDNPPEVMLIFSISSNSSMPPSTLSSTLPQHDQFSLTLITVYLQMTPLHNIYIKHTINQNVGTIKL